MVVNKMATNNEYLKQILESLVGTVSGTHSDNYYLKRIAEVCGYTYTGTVCNGKLYKDIVEEITQTTITGTHFNNYFLKRWAESVSGETYESEFDNYYLGIIANNPIPGRVTTVITIDPNATDLVYGDDFNITGTLTKNDLVTPIVGKPVYLKVGNTIVGSPQTTDSNGEVSFTYAPVATGNHSFQLVFNGSMQYSSSFSSVMNKTAQRETTILNVTSPANNSVCTDDGRIFVTGTLFDDDTPTANPIPNRRVNMRMTWINKRGSESFSSTFTQTTSRGNFIVEMSLPSYEDMSDTNKQCTLTVTHPESDNYASASTSIVLNIVKPFIELVSDKSILSYADSDVATLTATLHAYDNRNKTVSFYKANSQGDDELIGTGVTDSNGVAVCNNDYVSQGVGDVYVKATSGSFVSEIYEVEDCFMYRSSLSHTTGLSIQLPSDFEMSFNLKRTNGTAHYDATGSVVCNDGSKAYYVGGWGSLGQNGLLIRNNGSSSNLVNERCTDIANNTPTNIYYKYDNGLHTYMKDNETKTYNNSTYHPTEIREFAVGAMMSFTNFKIKSL